LGDGYSGIAVSEGALYTMYRRGPADVVVALDAASGKRLWEYAYEAPFTNAWSDGVGPGP
jgi:glucose dehydrogenase